MELKYSPARNPDTRKVQSAEKIVKIFVAGLNKYELPPPQDPSSDRIYLVNYKR